MPVPVANGPVNYDDRVQGDIESTAAKQPRELTAMFEAISGSEALRKDYEVETITIVNRHIFN